jgi:hypothetical protein
VLVVLCAIRHCCLTVACAAAAAAAVRVLLQDMTPYVPLLMPELQKALLDPLPEVRATAARAMGSLLKGMGAAALGDLLPWLLSTLRSEGSSVERSGAAQVRCRCRLQLFVLPTRNVFMLSLSGCLSPLQVAVNCQSGG